MALSRIIKSLLILLGFVAILHVTTNYVDPDLGWHLRFGSEFWQGKFSYGDSYTWSYFGKPWINHEWGGDLLFAYIHNNLGYLPIVLLTSLLPWLAFLMTIRIFRPRLTIASITVALFSVWAVHHILVARLSMFSAFFFVLLWWSLEKLPKRQTYYFWPALFWVWSILHGSWVLGFITIGIYVTGNAISRLTHLSPHRGETERGVSPVSLIERDPSPCPSPARGGMIIKEKILKYFDTKNLWSWKIIVSVLFWTLISLAVTLINPYGFDLWKEVAKYFTETYYKMHISEWLPSYTYPVYWQTVAIAGVSAVFIFQAIRKARLSLPQLLLYIAFFIAAVKYKRNALYLALICAPLISVTLEEAENKLLSLKKWAELARAKILKLTVLSFTLISILLLLIYHATNLRLVNNVWADQELLARYPMPIKATEILKKKIGNKATPVFNEFVWGGYLSWTVPQALLYFDGRGTATWKYSNEESMLEHYYKLVSEEGGLKEIEEGPAKFIMLAKNNNNLPAPNRVNRLLFTKADLDLILSNEPTVLQRELFVSNKWKLVYEDRVARLWERNQVKSEE